ncbi:hypothetical protein H5410_010085 [Solanum commersonii]|uniref:Uncharacterized protein n=1 Tax=Solanum commersonii TaxID=4109 RepID=A0A9J6AKM8_SOLCO|nr:hypothetical protein H5410_010085 [Solanum commersonii]
MRTFQKITKRPEDIARHIAYTCNVRAKIGAKAFLQNCRKRPNPPKKFDNITFHQRTHPLPHFGWKIQHIDGMTEWKLRADSFCRMIQSPYSSRFSTIEKNIN